jgi:hypothetical protein
MLNDPLLLVALAAFAVAVLFVFLKPAATPRGNDALSSTLRGSGRALLDALEQAGKEHAASFIESKLGERKAATVAAEIAAAFLAHAPKPADPAPAPTPNPAPSPPKAP